MVSANRIFTLVVFVFIALPLWSDTGAGHQVRLARPIRLGTSGGNNTDMTSAFCCSGTLGALVKDSAGVRYILSNNHVIAKSNTGNPGQPIGQPGLIDVRCKLILADPVANLSRFAQIFFDRPNKIDAAIARVIPGKVTRVGRILDIGRPGKSIEAKLGMLVKKSGRTTGRTLGKITAINTALWVDIPGFCGDENGKSARFVDQIVVETTNSLPFTDSGDSGALIVTRRKTCPRSVGLLFAGDDEGVAIGNRIQNVLSSLDVKIVGCASTSSTEVEIQGTHLDPAIQKVEIIRQRNEERFMRMQGVVGIGIGTNPQSIAGYAIVLLVEKGFAAKSLNTLPLQIDGVPVRILKTSGFKAR